MKTIDLIYFNAGGGHRASALALESVLREKGWPWQVRLVNLFEVLDPRGRFRQLTGRAPEDLYNQRLAGGWTLGMAQELKLLQGLIRLAHPTLVRRLQQHWLQTEPDMVVSLVPNFNRAMHESLASALPGVPYVTILTDLADHPPHFWIEADQRQHVICGTPRAVEQARGMGHGERHVHATSGMIIRPDFYRAPVIHRLQERQQLGLDPHRPTGLVLFGGQGSSAMLGIAKKLAATTQLILICGHNQKLASRLRALPQQVPRLVVEFTSDIPHYMQLADFLIGKPGPGSVSEAVRMGLPVLVVDNAWTMPQERYNAEWIRENHLGIVLGSFRSVERGVSQLLGQLDEFRASVRRIDNRALFEIPDLLANILQEADRLAPDGARLLSPALPAHPDTR